MCYVYVVCGDTAGNHDVLMHSEFYERHHWRFHTDKVERHLELKERLQSVCTYLEDDQCEVNGIKIWGSPWYRVMRE
jgi:hypothetical protein